MRVDANCAREAHASSDPLLRHISEAAAPPPPPRRRLPRYGDRAAFAAPTDDSFDCDNENILISLFPPLEEGGAREPSDDDSERSQRSTKMKLDKEAVSLLNNAICICSCTG